jgi:hypothetical protein
LLKAFSLSRLEEHMPLAARQRPLLADIVEKVGSGDCSKFLEAAGALTKKGAGGLRARASTKRRASADL